MAGRVRAGPGPGRRAGAGAGVAVGLRLVGDEEQWDGSGLTADDAIEGLDATGTATVLSDGVVGASRELLVVGDRLGVAVVLGVRPVHRGRHDVVVAPRQEQQGGTFVVVVVDPRLLRSRLEVGENAAPEDAAVGGDVVALVEGLGLLVGERVGEGVPPLLKRQPDSLVPVGRALQHRERRLHLRERHHAHALGRRRVQCDPSSADTVVEEDLGEGATCGVTHDDGRAVEFADDGLDPAQHAPAERQPGVAAGGGASDVAGADEEPVARDLRVGRVLAEGPQEQRRHAQQHSVISSGGVRRG